MTAKDDRIQARIEPNLKHAAEAIFANLGLSSGEAIRMFYAQVTLRGGIPFDVTVPNAQTIKAMEESLKPKKLDRYASFSDLRGEVGV